MNPIDRLKELRSINRATGRELAEMRPRFARLADRHTNGAAPVAVAAFNLFPTPVQIAAKLAAILSPAPGARILEPSAGTGRLLDALTPYNPAEIVAVEVAPECAGVLFTQARPGVTLRQRDFLACTPDDLGLFDGVAMNPPFHMRADVAHILHAVRFLKPGGTLAAICMQGRARRSAFSGPGWTWEDLPPGSFRETGTSTPTAIVTFTK